MELYEILARTVDSYQEKGLLESPRKDNDEIHKRFS